MLYTNHQVVKWGMVDPSCFINIVARLSVTMFYDEDPQTVRRGGIISSISSPKNLDRITPGHLETMMWFHYNFIIMSSSTTFQISNWLVVSTPLKSMSQLGWLFPIYGKIKNVPNHQPENILKVPHLGPPVDTCHPHLSCKASFNELSESCYLCHPQVRCDSSLAVNFRQPLLPKIKTSRSVAMLQFGYTVRHHLEIWDSILCP